jgi:hypothetical protein
MSGVLPGIALINNFDPNAELMRGAMLRIYQSGTSIPVTAFKDSALTAGQEHPWPIVADSAARLPIFYLPEGVYRVRLSSDDGGYIAYDVPALEAVSPSGDSGGGGGGGSVSPEVLFRTGYLMMMLGEGVQEGFVRLNGRSIGSSGSGATERANNDTQALYEYLWNEFADSICPVVGGRGASATADFNAGKTLTLIDGRGRTIYGADGMGATRANRLTTKTFATPDTVGTAGGSEAHTLTTGELPVVTPTFTGSGGTVNITNGNDDLITAGSIGGELAGGAGSGVRGLINPARGKSLSGSFTPSGTVSSFGSGESHATAAPGIIVTIYVKL